MTREDRMDEFVRFMWLGTHVRCRGCEREGMSLLYNVGSAQYNPEVLREWVWFARAHTGWNNSELFE